MTEFEQAIIRRAERHRHDSAFLHIHAGRQWPGNPRRHRAQFGMRAIGVGGDDFLTGLQTGDAFTHFDDLARRLIADDMRLAHQRAAETVQRVPAFDGDGFDANEYAARKYFRIRHVFIFQDGWRTVLVIDSGFHGGFLIAISVSPQSAPAPRAGEAGKSCPQPSWGYRNPCAARPRARPAHRPQTGRTKPAGPIATAKKPSAG